MTITDTTAPVLATKYQQSVADYWNQEKDPVNIRLGEVSGTFHHHYGIGDVDWSVLEGDEATRDERIIKELHRLEAAQADFLVEQLGALGPADRILDAGSGRGGTSFVANQRFGCQVDGISISEEQVKFANNQAQQRGVADKVAFHFRNMLGNGFPDATFQAIWNNESTMYVDLHELFAEHARVLKPGGRYVTITGCFNDVHGRQPSRAVSQIDAHYICDIHPRSAYFAAMSANDLIPISVVDLTAATIPYWELRAKSSVATGVEDPFLTAYKEGSFHYLMIAADRI
ncbi:methyltransferase domain-containing protein [Kitasatospora sp. NBC_01250]|uniref:geranyl diphosphate 2-C-methyltransferase n=1 Tax=unclassified Kitasatospora TaxID=2633591 RepID=UPI002E15BD74|nr:MULTISPECIES: geranyl diphosphate 2-C-methyltransferase [unclassified Kitasatospora]WSJ65543.1 methyltransferase domain-containing protein [Kitasatospora sp. NBC_01302]